VRSNLTYDPAPPSGAPTSIASRQMVEFRANTPFVVKSQDDKHPFYVAAYMTGCTEYSGNLGADCRGDPEFVNVVAPQQFVSSYTFFTDPTYPETELVVVRQKSHQGTFADVTMDCLGGAVTGWHAVDSGDSYEYARVDVETGNFMNVGMCNNGRHEMKSNTPFGLTVWGWGSMATGGAFRDPMVPGFYSQAVSYAYPAGMRVQPITTVTVAPTPR
jgi:IgGFc binding protein